VTIGKDGALPCDKTPGMRNMFVFVNNCPAGRSIEIALCSAIDNAPVRGKNPKPSSICLPYYRGDVTVTAAPHSGVIIPQRRYSWNQATDTSLQFVVQFWADLPEDPQTEQEQNNQYLFLLLRDPNGDWEARSPYMLGNTSRKESDSSLRVRRRNKRPKQERQNR